jgi:uncharacterized membrane protein
MLLAAMRLAEPFPLIPTTTVLVFAFAILHAGQREGWGRAAALAAILFGVGLAFECLGVATGLMFGFYHYTGQLGPKFLGLVPYLIPVAWTGMMYPALVISDRIIPASMRPSRRWLAVAALGGVVMTAWDVAMDPLMVQSGNWVWETIGPYYGVPLQNFCGWWVTTFVALALYQLVVGRKAEPRTAIPDQWALWAYAVTGTSTVIGDLAFGLEGAAIAGLAAMLPWVWIAAKNKGRDES